MSATMTRSLSPTPSLNGSGSGSSRKKSYSPTPSPKPFLTPNPFDNNNHNQTFSFTSSSSSLSAARPLARRVHSLQSSSSSTTTSIRSSPYQIPISQISPISPIISSGPSPSPSLSSGTGKPKRPNMNHRSMSFCASSQNSTYALASANTSSHLSPDKRILIAPPLERTLSSIGSKGNQSPPSQQMQKPFPSVSEIEFDVDVEDYTGDIENRYGSKSRNGSNASESSILSEKDVNCQSSQSNSALPSIPTIYVHSSITPPRPSLSTIRAQNQNHSFSNESSRSSSYTSTKIITPNVTTPHDLLFRPLIDVEERNEDSEELNIREDDHGRVKDSDNENQLSRGVDYLMI